MAGGGRELCGSVLAGVLRAWSGLDVGWVATAEGLQGVGWGAAEVGRLLDGEHVGGADVMLGFGAEVEVEVDRAG